MALFSKAFKGRPTLAAFRANWKARYGNSTGMDEQSWQLGAPIPAPDTGAHATGQVVAFDLDWQHPTSELQRALNGILPGDIAVQAIREVNARFHPRYHATWRRYRYQIYCRPVRQPLLDRYAWHVWPAVELPRLQEVASLLIGTHEFAAFGTPPRPASSTVRTVFQAKWWEQSPHLSFEITAQAFLYHMVRRLVHMQVQVGQGRLELETIRQTLLKPNETPDKGSPLRHGLAPACGLTLVAVGYPAEAFAIDEDLEIEQTTANTDATPIR